MHSRWMDGEEGLLCILHTWNRWNDREEGGVCLFVYLFVGREWVSLLERGGFLMRMGKARSLLPFFFFLSFFPSFFLSSCFPFFLRPFSLDLLDIIGPGDLKIQAAFICLSSRLVSSCVCLCSNTRRPLGRSLCISNLFVFCVIVYMMGEGWMGLDRGMQFVLMSLSSVL